MATPHAAFRRPMGRMARARRELGAVFSRDWRGLLTALAVLMFLLVAIGLPLSGSREGQLSAYDNDWNDISRFRYDLETLPYLNITTRAVTSTAAVLTSIDDARSMLYVAIGVERPYTFAEWRGIRTFMSRGGVVLVADDYGYGNSLLRYNGYREDPAISHASDRPNVQYLFSEERLADTRVDRNPLLVRLRVPVTEHLEFDVLLNDPSCFELNEEYEGHDHWDPWDPWDPGYTPDTGWADPAEIIANSTPESWLDRDRDSTRDPGEPVGTYPVMLVQDGYVLISDPSLFTNDMYDRRDNRQFARALVARLLPRGGTIIFDESVHLEPGAPISELDDMVLRPLTALLGEEWPIYVGILVMLVLTTGSVASARRAWHRHFPHRHRLDEPRRLEFGQPYNWLADYYEVRGVLLQRMRYAYGLDPDELQRLPPEMVAQLLGHQYLARFVLQPVRVDPEALRSALADIVKWTPPRNAEDLVERAEAYLAASEDAPVAPPGAPPRPFWGGGAR